MTKILNFTLCFIIICLTACSSHEDEPEYPMADIDETTISSYVNGEGEQISISFTANTPWIIEGPENVTITPKSGGKGSNTVLITVPMNESTKNYSSYKFIIYTSGGDYITDFSIYQEPAPFIECNERLQLEQDGQRSSLTIKASVKPTVSYQAAWLTTELEKVSDTSDETYYFRAEATENAGLEERTTVVVLSVGNLKKEILISQKGGVLLKHELYDAAGNLLKDMDGSGYNYSISPVGGSFTLKVAANCPWTVEKSSKWWPENFNVNQISKDDNSATFNISIKELSKDATSTRAALVFSFKDNVEREIEFIQDDWGISIYVNQGESLKDKIEKVRDKLNEGFFIDYICINGGNIDTYAPSTVRQVSISNIDNIMEGFCERCDNLTSLSMSNVKKIGARAFIGHNLGSISIPATVTYIGDRAFLKTRWYPHVTCYNPKPPTLGTWVFHNGAGDGELRIPMGSKPAYKANSSWSKQFSSYTEF